MQAANNIVWSLTGIQSVSRMQDHPETMHQTVTVVGKMTGISSTAEGMVPTKIRIEGSPDTPTGTAHIGGGTLISRNNFHRAS